MNAIPAIKQLSHLPIILDPSHATGKWGLVGPVSKAGVAAGCDGLLIEVHTNPEEAVSDGEQSLNPGNFKTLIDELGAIAKAVGRSM